MNINIDKIKEIYGMDILNLIRKNIKDVVINIKYLENLGFQDVEDIFERFTLIFIDDKEQFSKKMDELISNIGPNYLEIIENDLSTLEELI